MTTFERPLRNLSTGALARVEGEGGLDIVVEDGVVQDVRLRIYEPPRFFESLLRGRSSDEVPDLTARICGICPVAYQVSSCSAMEDLGGVELPPAIDALRRLLYLGEWVESHVLHVAFLHAPDFLGLDGIVDLAAACPEQVALALRLKEAGNALVTAVGGRPIHPVNVRVGGFYRAPSVEALQQVGSALRAVLDDALGLVAWVAGFDFPDLELDHELVALAWPGEYPVHRGRLVSDRGLDLAVQEFPRAFVEEQVPHSTALHAHRRPEGRYLTGPLARYTLSSTLLRPLAREAAERAGLGPACRNPFRSIVVRAVEVVHAVDEAIALIDAYEPPVPAAVDVPRVAGVGHGASEAPRGVLYHRYEVAADGSVLAATIVPPTAQNLDAIEADVRAVVEAGIDVLDDEVLARRCEQAIRNHDPCISCATHFLDLRVDRRGPAVRAHVLR